MTDKPIKLTKADLKTIRFALNCAIDERDSYAEAYSRTGPIAEEASAAVKRFERLHRKLFGEQSANQKLQEDMAAQPAVSIFQIMKGDQ